MSNKLLALLILIGTISGMFLLYFYFFVGYTSQLTINANIENYQVELYSKKIGKTFDYTCEESACVLTDISPLDYSLRLRKDGYKAVYQDIEVPSRSSISVDINAIQEISFTESVSPEVELSNKDRISYLRDKNKAYKFFDFENGKYAYFTQTGGLYMYRGLQVEKLGDFTLTDKAAIDVKYINESEYIYFQIDDSKYLYHVDKGTITSIDIGVDISYIKSGDTSGSFIFITDVGAYTYSILSDSFEYFYLFKDFVYLEDSYVGVIYTEEEKKLQNFNLEDKTSNLILKYDIASKQREILYETSLDIENIYRDNDQIYFEVEGKRYELQNY